MEITIIHTPISRSATLLRASSFKCYNGSEFASVLIVGINHFTLYHLSHLYTQTHFSKEITSDSLSPFRSPLIGASQLVYIPRLINMLKFSRLLPQTPVRIDVNVLQIIQRHSFRKTKNAGDCTRLLVPSLGHLVIDTGLASTAKCCDFCVRKLSNHELTYHTSLHGLMRPSSKQQSNHPSRSVLVFNYVYGQGVTCIGLLEM